jgi:serine phosphatase RsbU (regulator of sigma subunit)
MAERIDIGGDWYDAFVLPDGRLALAVGDVTGHDLRAATVMGQVRNAVRAYATEHPQPGAVLARVNTLLARLPDLDLVTMLFGVYDPVRHELVWSNAGHPPPLLRRGDGTVELLTGNLSPLIGATRAAARDCTEVHCRPGDVLVLHTDGLIESPGNDPDERTELLARTLGDQSDVEDVGALCDHVLDVLGADGLRDDAVLLAIRLGA